MERGHESHNPETQACPRLSLGRRWSGPTESSGHRTRNRVSSRGRLTSDITSVRLCSPSPAHSAGAPAGGRLVVQSCGRQGPQWDLHPRVPRPPWDPELAGYPR